jgi:hypothetical protein
MTFETMKINCVPFFLPISLLDFFFYYLLRCQATTSPVYAVVVEFMCPTLDLIEQARSAE